MASLITIIETVALYQEAKQSLLEPFRMLFIVDMQTYATNVLNNRKALVLSRVFIHETEKYLKKDVDKQVRV